jgi:hypothetical protein
MRVSDCGRMPNRDDKALAVIGPSRRKIPSAESFAGDSSPFGMLAPNRRAMRVMLRRSSVAGLTGAERSMVGRFFINLGLLIFGVFSSQ